MKIAMISLNRRDKKAHTYLAFGRTKCVRPEKQYNRKHCP